jgi:hypothetical protein
MRPASWLPALQLSDITPAPKSENAPQTPEPKSKTSTSMSRPSDEDDIREAVFRFQFTSNFAGAKPFVTLFFLSVEDGRDPTDEFMARFRNPAHRVKKVSQSFMASALDGVQDRKTEKPGVILQVAKISWMSKDEVSVEGGHYKNGRNSAFGAIENQSGFAWQKHSTTADRHLETYRQFGVRQIGSRRS